MFNGNDHGTTGHPSTQPQAPTKPQPAPVSPTKPQQNAKNK